MVVMKARHGGWGKWWSASEGGGCKGQGYEWP
jgi:hypothetical protein